MLVVKIRSIQKLYTFKIQLRTVPVIKLKRETKEARTGVTENSRIEWQRSFQESCYPLQQAGIIQQEHLRRQLHDNWQSVENNRQAGRGGGFRPGRGDEKRREVKRKRNGRAYRASSPAASKRSSNGKLSPTGVPPHPTVLLDVPRPRVSQLTFAKTPPRRRVSSCTTDRRIFQPVFLNLVWPRRVNVDRSFLHRCFINYYFIDRYCIGRRYADRCYINCCFDNRYWINNS